MLGVPHPSDTYSVEQLELPGEDHSVSQLRESIVLFNIFEPLQVQRQYPRQFLHPQSLGRLLLAAALLTVIL